MCAHACSWVSAILLNIFSHLSCHFHEFTSTFRILDNAFISLLFKSNFILSIWISYFLLSLLSLFVFFYRLKSLFKTFFLKFELPTFKSIFEISLLHGFVLFFYVFTSRLVSWTLHFSNFLFIHHISLFLFLQATDLIPFAISASNYGVWVFPWLAISHQFRRKKK